MGGCYSETQLRKIDNFDVVMSMLMVKFGSAPRSGAETNEIENLKLILQCKSFSPHTTYTENMAPQRIYKYTTISCVMNDTIVNFTRIK